MYLTTHIVIDTMNLHIWEFENFRTDSVINPHTDNEI